MSLSFGSATSDRVNCGSGSSLDNLATGTIACWIYLDNTNNTVKYFAGKITTNGWEFHKRGANGTSFRFSLKKSSTADMISNTSVLSANTWLFLAATWNANGTGAMTGKLWKGTLTAVVADVTNTVTGASGAQADDSAESMVWGNVSPSGTSAVEGDLAKGWIFNRELTQGELIYLQFGGRIPQAGGCVGYWEFGHNGTGTQPDWSGNGNAGTVTGATLANHVPLGTPFGIERGFSDVPLYVSSLLLNSLGAYYKLDESSGTRQDSHGGWHLTDNNTVTSTTGKVGTAAQFTAANSEYLSVATGAGLQVFGSVFTVAGWVNLNNTTFRGGVVGNLNGNANFAIESNGGTFNATLDGFTTFGQIVGLFTASTWIFLAVVYDGSQSGNANRLKVYKNNVQQTVSFTGTIPASFASGSTDLWIGRGFAGAQYWDGLLDEIGLWNRALTVQEIDWLYRNGNGQTYENFAGLIPDYAPRSGWLSAWRPRSYVPY